ncbi:family 1 glycosylhydrolase [Deinococcus peraridilitoris]|uniref:dTDP-4-dehydrorhamnose reductase n=1 Tax=Deinococcus peraridilitoris (strain DSM 19664 / LMG 22246 / CIP 109416 / KR-200) TaxID=937777 RepID=L0A3X0_DEIPD|nr:family 1 glycosylhydrolase [Deinococcus peraridilitoris]AFZ67710.1 dTDP-4-dehydrorhamnose reductase [Deinococcus peraridilitoris DSM 19664]
MNANPSQPPKEQRPLELWIGVECTLNRVQDRYLNQLTVCGHDRRQEDLTMLAGLGAKRIRYPVLWEQVAPERPDLLDWSWTDERLQMLRELNLQPIATLLHHGSGPTYTDMLDPEFPEKLAAYARQVAERYGWLTAYTPVNEPLTTARFSGLYGVWYPHHKSDESFVRMLLNECKGTVLAMRAIREVRPDAQLVQTDDLGKAHATPAMQHEADFQNERRWLAYDLLCGRVNEEHALWAYLLSSGATPEELAWFAQNPCPPDIVGVDYYVTSERFLDERKERYPAHQCGPTHADVEAVRVYQDLAGIEKLLREVWQRYEIPVAITEAHLGSTREEQLRWFDQFWQAAKRVRSEGADIRAVTSWAILGSFDWNTLHTEFKGHYEPGAFDVRGLSPRPTALAQLLRARASGVEPQHPVLASPGFWERPDRFFYPVVGASTPQAHTTGFARPLLILGEGRLSAALSALCFERGLTHRCLSKHELNVTDAAAVRTALRQFQPWAVVNAGAYGQIEEAQHQRRAFWQRHAVGLAVLARACAEHDIQLLTFSSDQVFAGDRHAPYEEHDPAGPLNVYGRTLLESERQALAFHPGTLIVRSSELFGASGEQDLLSKAVQVLRAGGAVSLDREHRFSPTYLPDLVHTSLDLLVDGERGTWHLVNRGETTWADFTRMVAEARGMSAQAVRGVHGTSIGWIAPRPRYSALGSVRGQVMPSLEHALERYLADAAD